jgi:hypothetical protein
MIVDGRNDPRSLKGVERRRELRELNASEVEQITSQLLAGLGRPPVGGETVAAEVIAATTVKARRIREQGRDDSEERQLLRQLLAFSPFGMALPMPPRVDPAVPGTYFVATKGAESAPDEVTNAE